jgi:hypothetical protein
VGRRLQKHQLETTASLDAMQCQMQMMTAMMSKMQTSIDKISPDQGTVAAPAPPHINGRDYHTSASHKHNTFSHPRR